MRAERSWYLASLAGAFAILVAYVRSIRAEAPLAVRDGWLDATPALLSITALLGIALAGWRPATATLGKAVAGAALGALATHLLLALFVPLAPDEPASALAWAALDVAGWASLPALVLVAMDERTPPRAAAWSLRALTLVAVLLAARVVWNAWTMPEPLRVGIAVSWASFVLAGGWAVVKLLQARVAKPAPGVTPAATRP